MSEAKACELYYFIKNATPGSKSEGKERRRMVRQGRNRSYPEGEPKSSWPMLNMTSVFDPVGLSSEKLPLRTVLGGEK